MIIYPQGVFVNISYTIAKRKATYYNNFVFIIMEVLVFKNRIITFAYTLYYIYP